MLTAGAQGQEARRDSSGCWSAGRRQLESRSGQGRRPPAAVTSISMLEKMYHTIMTGEIKRKTS
jgi:hypothetical protein